MKVLIIGGNRFVGKRLAKLFIENGDDVTLLNRGNLNDDFGNLVKRLSANRQKKEELERVVIDQTWDIIYDQICYTAADARLSCEFFNKRTSRYIVISSQSVYDDGPFLQEKHFDPYNYIFDKEVNPFSDLSFYQESKRQMEAVFAKDASFKLGIIRFPYIFGRDDYSKRFSFHVDKIKNNQAIFFTKPELKFSIISSEDAACALYQLSILDFSGPINLASPDAISYKDFASTIALALNRNLFLAKTCSEDNQSPIDTLTESFMDVSFARSLGIKIAPTREWIKKEALAIL